MDIDHLQKLLEAVVEECDRLNTDGPAYEEFLAYVDKERHPALLRRIKVLEQAKNEACDLVSDCLDTLTAYPAYEEPGADRVETELARLRKV